jgi:hypothetical protein
MNLLTQELEANASQCRACLATYHALREERNHLIERAWLLHREGDEPDSGASVQEIARATGLSRMSVYSVIKRYLPVAAWPTSEQVLEGQVSLIDTLAGEESSLPRSG